MKKKMVKITKFYLIQDVYTISDVPDFWIMLSETLIDQNSVEKEIDRILNELRADHHYTKFPKVVINRAESVFSEEAEIEISFFNKEFNDMNEHYLIKIKEALI